MSTFLKEERNFQKKERIRKRCNNQEIEKGEQMVKRKKGGKE